MIDIHCHMLPGVDDGADCLGTALSMARQAIEGGTRQVVLTPHFLRPEQRRRLSASVLVEETLRLQETFAREKLPLILHTGMEVFAGEDLPQRLRRGELLTLAGSRYLLVEFFFDEDAQYMDRMLLAVRERGLWPVVAHPERYVAVQRHPGLAAQWFARGDCLQLNQGSILGSLGQASARAAWWLLRRGLAHTVASDGHSDIHRRPDLGRVRRFLERELGTAYARLLLEENPASILENTSMIRPQSWQGELR